MEKVWLVLREGLIFGVLAGIFALIIRLVSAQATGQLAPSPFASFVAPALGLLIIGGAGRKLAAMTKSTNAAIQMGALAGGISEIFRSVLAAIVLSYLPVGVAAAARMTAADRAAASDPGRLVTELGIQLGLAVVFGALTGWLGAWSFIQSRPPRDRRS